MKNFKFNSSYFFLIAVLLGFLFPSIASSLDFLVVPLLVLMMTFSLKDISFRHIKIEDAEEISLLLLLNYVVVSIGYVSFGYFFLESPYKEAVMLLGLMPPAVGLLALAKMLKGNMFIAFVTEFVAYFAAIVIIPVMVQFLFGTQVGIIKVLETLFYVMVLPFFFSRLLHDYEKKHPRYHDHTRTIINICYTITFFIIIGINKEFIFKFYETWNIYLILIILKFGFGLLLYFLFKNRLSKKNHVLVVLFGTMKNGGAAIAFAILLFGIESTVPYAINAITLPLFLIFLEWIFKN